MLHMPKGFDLRCGAGKTARVWVQGKGGALTPGQPMVLLPCGKERIKIRSASISRRWADADRQQ
jgi:hypothetical protein